MAEITPVMIKDLRERSGAGVMDCKLALVEADGSLDNALELLQKKGKAKVHRVAERIAADGIISAMIASSGHTGVIIEANCLTDTVARTDEFKHFATQAATRALAPEIASIEGLLDHVTEGSSLRALGEELSRRSGEPHSIRRLQRFDSAQGIVTAYIHHGARLGVLVELVGTQGRTQVLRDMANEIAMQIASMGPRYVRREDIPADVVARQRDIFAAQLQTEQTELTVEVTALKQRVEADPPVSDKVKQHLKTLEVRLKALRSRPLPPADRMIDARIIRWFTEVVLLDQTSIRDSSKTVAQMLLETRERLEVRRFVRFELGEGIEKKPVKSSPPTAG